MPNFQKRLRTSIFNRGRGSVPRLYMHAIFSLAAVVALATSACGKSDGGGGATAPVPATSPAPAAQASTSDVGHVAGVSTAAGELDKQSATSASTTLKRGDDIDDISGTEGHDESDPLNKLLDPEPKKKKIVRESLDSVVYLDSNGLTPDQIFAKKNKVTDEGAFLGESVRSDIVSLDGKALFYSGSGQDMLRDELYALVNERESKVSEKTREGDKKLAQTIQLGSFNVDWPSRRAQLKFVFERVERTGLKRNVVTMDGPLDPNGIFEVMAPNHMHLKAQVACMDLGGGCKTVHVRVQESSTGHVRTADIIARHTNATLYVNDDRQGTGLNAEYDRLLQVFKNTVDISNKVQPLTPDKITDVTLMTSETIGGSSNLAANLKIYLRDRFNREGGDVLELTGPLVKPRGTDDLNVGLNLTRIPTVVNGEVVPTDAIPTQGRFVETISNARLLKNDGHGNLQMQLVVRAATIGAPEETIRLTIGRIHTPTTTLRLPMYGPTVTIK